MADRAGETAAGPAGRPPALLAVAHGTRDPAGPGAVRALLARVRALRPGLRVAEAYGELSAPLLEDAAAGLGEGPVVVVPLLLGRGYHALIDIPERAGRLLPVSATARPLGPDSLLTDALTGLLAGVLGGAPGVTPGDGPPDVPGGAPRGRPRSLLPLCRTDAVVLGAAGSADPAGVADVRAAARLLARRLRRPVPHAFAAADGPRLRDVVADLRRVGARRVAVASYLLAPGRFHNRIADCGADAVTPPLGAHPAVARLVLRRYDEARQKLDAAVTVR